MALRAVIFDFGMVLTGTPNQEAHDAMVRITGLPVERFESLYWADRHAYDEGKLSGITFWQKLLHDAELDLGPNAVHELNQLRRTHVDHAKPGHGRLAAPPQAARNPHGHPLQYGRLSP